MDFSLSEILVVGVLAILVWGRQLPGAARELAKYYTRFRRGMTDLRDELQRHATVDLDEPLPEPEVPPVVPKPKKKRRRKRRA